MNRRQLFHLAILALAFGGCAAAEAAPPPLDRVVVLVRHAEKGPGDDPELSPAGVERARTLAHVLSRLPVDALYTSQFRRTGQTAVPLSEATGVAAEVVDAREVTGLATRIAEGDARAVVVIGHSNTVPALVGALGIADPPAISEETYDDLFVVRLVDGGEPRLLHLKYGAPTP